MSILAPWTCVFAPQPCQECGQVKPLAELEPLEGDNGNLIGFRCAAAPVREDGPVLF